jgi:two-component system response regulator NreC
MRITGILLLEDLEIVRKGIKMLINEQSDLNVICEAEKVATIMEKVSQTNPDVIVMNIGKPMVHSLQAVIKVKKAYPKIKIVMLTRYPHTSYVQRFSDAGADGYVLKSSSPAVLISAIRTVMDGKSFLDPAAEQKIPSEAGKEAVLKGEPGNVLTVREEDVFILVARGYSNKTIADQLNISVKTVETHKANAMKKLNVQDRVDIVNYAILKGWLNDD